MCGAQVSTLGYQLSALKLQKYHVQAQKVTQVSGQTPIMQQVGYTMQTTLLYRLVRHRFPIHTLNIHVYRAHDQVSKVATKKVQAALDHQQVAMKKVQADDFRCAITG